MSQACASNKLRPVEPIKPSRNTMERDPGDRRMGANGACWAHNGDRHLAGREVPEKRRFLPGFSRQLPDIHSSKICINRRIFIGSSVSGQEKKVHFMKTKISSIAKERSM